MAADPSERRLQRQDVAQDLVIRGPVLYDPGKPDHAQSVSMTIQKFASDADYSAGTSFETVLDNS